MMAGTDGGGQVPGQSLHQEFDELFKAGLSPPKILRMTTLKPAEFLGRTATMAPSMWEKMRTWSCSSAYTFDLLKQSHFRIALFRQLLDLSIVFADPGSD